MFSIRVQKGINKKKTSPVLAPLHATPALCDRERGARTGLEEDMVRMK